MPMLCDEKPKTTQEIETELKKYLQRDKKIVKILWAIFLFSTPLYILTIFFPDITSKLTHLSPITNFIVVGLPCSLSLLLLLILKFVVRNDVASSYQLLKPASEKDIQYCNYLLEKEIMQPWHEYISQVESLGRELYNYETQEMKKFFDIQSYWSLSSK